MQLTQRQSHILKAVVELHHATGRPVGSKLLVEQGYVDASSSTVRYELGRLEELGLLEHPHTSAGRVPTDRGWRVYVDELMDVSPAPRTGEPYLGDDRSDRIDEALRETTRRLADATGLLAVITAPRANGAVIRHVEVLQLQPNRIAVVVITATGDVARHVVGTPTAIDPGLVDWAGEYLNERVAGLAVGDNRVRGRLVHPELSPAERAMLVLIAPVFDELEEAGQELHVDGSSAEAIARQGDDVQRVLQLVAMLDERRRLLEALRPIVDRGVPSLHPGRSRSVSIRIGCENDLPELQRLSVVGAAYGVGARPLGMVGLIGPRSMNYVLATRVVNLAADGLSDLADELYGATR